MKTLLFTCFIVVANLSVQVFAKLTVVPLKDNDTIHSQVIRINVEVMDLNSLLSVPTLLTPIIGNVSMIGRNYNDVIEEYNRVNIDHLSVLNVFEILELVVETLTYLKNYETKVNQKYYRVREFVKYRQRSPLVFKDFNRLSEAKLLVFKNFHSVIDRLSKHDDILNFVESYKNEITSGIGFLIRLIGLKRLEDVLDVHINEIVNSGLEKVPIVIPMDR